MNGNSLEEIWNFLLSKKRILMVLHPNPDGDSLASCLSLKTALERESGCKVDILSKDELENSLVNLGYSKSVKIKRSVLANEINLSYDLLVALDCGDKDRALSIFRDPSNVNIPIVNIDHHETNPHYGVLNYIDKTAVSTCSVIFDLLKKNNLEVTPNIAEFLLVGIMTDSNSFRVGSNVEKAVGEAKELIDLGADYKKLINGIYNTSLRIKKYQSELINNLTIKKNFGYCIIDYDKFSSFDIKPSEASVGNKILDDLEEISAYFVLTEREKGVIKCSMRSRDGNKIDVSKIALKFGGGGSKQAAGFIITNRSLGEIMNLVLKEFVKI